MATGSEISSPPIIDAARNPEPPKPAPLAIGHSSFENNRPIASRLIRTLLVAGALVVGVSVALFYFIFDPTRVSIFPPCLFHELTGLDCPGCGAQRALHQLLHGHLVAAIRLNVMFVFSLPLFAWLGARFLVHNFRGERVNFQFKWWGAYVVAWIVFAVLRNLPFPVFQWFAA